MGLFAKKICCRCGKEAGLLTGTEISNKQKLCFDCSQNIPSNWNSVKEWDINDVESFLEYYKNTEERANFFEVTDTYGNLVFDEKHGWFYIKDGILGNSAKDGIIFDTRNIEDISIVFVPETYKEGVFTEKVKGEVVLEITSRLPRIYQEYIIKNNEKAPAKKTGILKHKIEYQIPEKAFAMQMALEQSIATHQK